MRWSAFVLVFTCLSVTGVRAGGEESPPAGMVLVPGGECVMGSDGKARDEDRAERPKHTVTLGAYYIDVREVTVAQYAAFLNAVQRTEDAQGHPFLGMSQYSLLSRAGGTWKPMKGKGAFPMVNVTWYGARAYAEWAGKRLPTEAEWERAARGTDGRRFPWGEERDESRLRFGQDKLGPVGAYPRGASPVGCLDMAGSVWEWTASLYKPYPYDEGDGRENPDAEGRRVARGGSWTGEPHIMTTTYRFRPEPGFAHRYIGFRCAKSAEQD